MIIHKVEKRRCTRRRVPSSFSHKEGTRPLCGAKAGPAKHLGLSVRETVAGRFRPWRHTLHTRKTKGTHAVRVTLFYPSMDTKGVDCPKRKRPPQRDTNTAFRFPFQALPQPGEKGRQLSPSSRLPGCFAVPPGWGKKRSSTLLCGRRTDARLGHGVVTLHSGSYWIINTLDNLYKRVSLRGGI
ncbi:hypothetical protein [Aneurinibacillus aneurinilyticus]|uniref:hypothetical protein n=1 Tax=Aneurinibacillus aneurinilyticus TaxID=1391 RepID=UPI003523E2FD